MAGHPNEACGAERTIAAGQSPRPQPLTHHAPALCSSSPLPWCPQTKLQKTSQHGDTVSYNLVKTRKGLEACKEPLRPSLSLNPYLSTNEHHLQWPLPCTSYRRRTTQNMPCATSRRIFPSCRRLQSEPALVLSRLRQII